MDVRAPAGRGHGLHRRRGAARRAGCGLPGCHSICSSGSSSASCSSVSGRTVTPAPMSTEALSAGRSSRRRARRSDSRRGVCWRVGTSFARRWRDGVRRERGEGFVVAAYRHLPVARLIAELIAAGVEGLAVPRCFDCGKPRRSSGGCRAAGSATPAGSGGCSFAVIIEEAEDCDDMETKDDGTGQPASRPVDRARRRELRAGDRRVRVPPTSAEIPSRQSRQHRRLPGAGDGHPVRIRDLVRRRRPRDQADR